MTDAEQPNQPASTKESQWWDGLWREHLPLLAGVGSALFVAFRILGIANFNSETAYAILQAAGTGTIVIGILLASAGIIAYFAVIACISRYFFLRQSTKHDERQMRVLITVGTLFSVIAIFTTPVILIAELAIIFIGGLLNARFRPSNARINEVIHSDKKIRRLLKGLFKRRISATLGTRFLLMAFALLFVLIVITAPPSLPVEELAIKDSHPIAAYVLSDHNNNYVILLLNSNKVEHIDDVQSVKLCEANNYGILSTIPSLIPASQPRYPLCGQH